MIFLKKALALLILVLLCYALKAEQFNIPDGDIAALKAAINTANSNNQSDTIHLAPFGMYRFTTADNAFLMMGDNALPPLKLDNNVSNTLVIFGNGATFMRDPSIDVLRLLYVLDIQVTIYDLNLIGGTTLQFDDEGGAIMINSADVTLENCLLKDCRASQGGAVYMVSSTSSFIAKNCTFTGNTASAGSGAAFASMYGYTYLQNCVVVNNRCLNVNVPAAIYNTIPLNANTATDNIYLKNCIVAKNIYDNPISPNHGKEFDLEGAVYSDGGNVIGSYRVVSQVSHPTFRQGTPGARNDYVGTETVYVDPLLSTFGDNGLFTESYSLLPGSPALQNNAGIKNAGWPAIASNGIAPSEAYPEGIVTITGINLAAVNKVQFSGSPTTTTGITATARRVTVAAHPSARTGTILLMTSVPQFIFTTQELKIKEIVTPSAPSNVIGTARSTSSVSLGWDDVSNEENYQVEYKRSQDITYSVLGTVSADVTTYEAENLLCNTTYDFRVMALGRRTQSAPSQAVSLAPAQLAEPVVVPSSNEGCSGEEVTITAPLGFSSYTWNNGETSQTINVGSAGDYSVQVTDAGGCVSDFSIPVSILFYNYPGTTVTRAGNVLETPVIADRYQWLLNNDTIENATTNSFTVTESGIYMLELSNRGCVSSSEVITIPSAVTPSFVTSSTTVCAGSTGVRYSATFVSNAVYHWTYSGTGTTIVSGSGTNSITVDFNSAATSGTLSVRAEMNGIKGEERTLPIAVESPPTLPDAIAGKSTITEGSPGNIYSVDNQPNATFDWSYSGTGAMLTENENTVSIDYAEGASSGTLFLIVNNNCGTTSRSLAIVIEPVMAPSFIKSSTAVCAGSTGVDYSVTSIENAVYYWTYTGSGMTIVSGAGTHSIMAEFSPSATSGTLLVEIEQFGIKSDATELPIRIENAPMSPGEIKGRQSIAGQASNGNTYSIAHQDNVLFDWSYSGSGATLLENSNTVTIDFDEDATSGNLSVIISNNCGSTSESLPIVIEPVLTAIGERTDQYFSIHPNPSHGKFTLIHPEHSAQHHITVFNLAGRKIHETVGHDQTLIELPDTPAGIYFVIIKTKDNTFMRKAVIR